MQQKNFLLLVHQWVHGHNTTSFTLVPQEDRQVVYDSIFIVQSTTGLLRGMPFSDYLLLVVNSRQTVNSEFILHSCLVFVSLNSSGWYVDVLMSSP